MAMDTENPRVAIDAQALLLPKTGVGQYTYNLLRWAKEIMDPGTVWGYYFNFLKRHTVPRQELCNMREIFFVPRKVAQCCHKHICVPPWTWYGGKADIYHFPNFITRQTKNTKTVVTIHDMGYLRYPKTIHPHLFRQLIKSVRHSVIASDLILTDSQFSKDEILHFFSCPEEKVQVVYLGADASFGNFSKETRPAMSLPEHYVLSVVTYEPRKNVPCLVKAFAIALKKALLPPETHLVIVGAKGWLKEKERCVTLAKREGIKGRMHFLDYVPNEQLPALYAGSSLFVFPSLYEGFGIPAVEAASSGLPLLLSDIPVHREVWDKNALYFATDQPEDCAKKMGHILKDKDLWQHHAKAGKEHAKQYTWQKTAEQTFALYRELMQNGPCLFRKKRGRFSVSSRA